MQRSSVKISAVLLVLASLLSLTACGGSESSDGDEAPGTGIEPAATTGERITIGDDEALRWGDGAAGVVLAHGAAFDAASWEDQAVLIAGTDRTVVAVEDIAPQAIVAAVEYLRDEMGLDSIALVGGSAGANAILEVDSGDAGIDPEQLILLSPTRTVEGLGAEPKLFIASEDEPVADVSVELAESAPGPDNESILVPGSAHAQNLFDTDQADRVNQAILDRLVAKGL